MKAMLRSFRAAALLLGVAAVPVIAAPMSTAPVAIIAAAPASVTQPAAVGDPPRRRGRRAPGKDKPYQPLAKDPQGESATAHKDYLKRYGF